MAIKKGHPKENSIDNFQNQKFLDTHKVLIKELTCEKFKPEDWVKLAIHWGFTSEQISAIESTYSGKTKKYESVRY